MIFILYFVILNLLDTVKPQIPLEFRKARIFVPHFRLSLFGDNRGLRFSVCATSVAHTFLFWEGKWITYIPVKLETELLKTAR